MLPDPCPSFAELADPRRELSDDLGWLVQKPEWADLRAVGRVESTRIVGEQTTAEHRYYLTTLTTLTPFAYDFFPFVRLTPHTSLRFYR